MDWKKIIERLTVGRLVEVAEAIGYTGVAKKRKAQLVSLLADQLDEPLKYELLALQKGSDLRAIASERGVHITSDRRREIIAALLNHQDELDTLPLSIGEIMLPDAQRLDLPRSVQAVGSVQLLPARPRGDDGSVHFEIQRLLRRPTLRRAFIVTPDVNSPMLCQLLGQGLDDFIESTVQTRRVEGDGPLVTIVLDGESSGLDKGEFSQVLISLAKELPGRLALRLSEPGRRIDATVFGFEELLSHGSHYTAICGSGGARWVGGRGDRAEASVLLGGRSFDTHQSSESARHWIRAAVGGSRRLEVHDLQSLEGVEWARRKVAYKRFFDTGHELRLKHLAERLARRGRVVGTMFDPEMLLTPSANQMLAVALASEVGCEGVLLCDEPGMGKGVQAAMIVARELRRKRIFSAGDAIERRRAVVVAQRARHGDWREVFEGMFGLLVHQATEATSSVLSQGAAAVVLATPEEVASGWERYQDADLLVVDDAHLCSDMQLAALSSVRRGVDMAIVVSASPVHSDLSDIWPLASLADPHVAWDAVTDVDEHQAELGEVLRSMTARSHRDALLDESLLALRETQEIVVQPSRSVRLASRELRAMRLDYLARSEAETAWAFVALEEALASSPQALVAETSMCLDASGTGRSFTEHEDDSSSVITGSPYFRHRLTSVRESLRQFSRPDAPTSPKEAELLAQLAKRPGQRVVVCTKYRATQERLAMVIARARLCPTVEILDGGATLSARHKIVSGFIAASDERVSSDGPKGVLLCTDHGMQGLSLAKAARVLCNYDIPLNPQRMERRVSRLERYGEGGRVEVLNIVYDHVDGAPSLGRRALAAGQLFSVDDADGGRRASLFELDSTQLEATLADPQEASLELSEPADGEALKLLDRLLEGAAPEPVLANVEHLKQLDREYRDTLRDFWERASWGQNRHGGASHFLFDRVELALRQGQMGILCAAGTPVDQCRDFHLVVGLRVLYESADSLDQQDPLDEGWLIEDEEVCLWAVGSDDSLSDWQSVLLEGGQIEAPIEDARRIVGEGLVNHLLQLKSEMESLDKDATNLADWMHRAPEAVTNRLSIAEAKANAMAEGVLAKQRQAWARQHALRVQRLDTRLERARAMGLDAEQIEDLNATRDRELSREVRFRHEVLGTQLFVVLHA